MWTIAAALGAPTVGLGGTVAVHPASARTRGAVAPSALVELRASPAIAVKLEGGLGLGWGRKYDGRLAIDELGALQSETRGFGTAMFVASPSSGSIGPTSSRLALDLGLGIGVMTLRRNVVGAWGELDPGVSALTGVEPTLNWSVGPRVALGAVWDGRLRVQGAHWLESTVEDDQLRQRHRAQVDLGLAVVRSF